MIYYILSVVGLLGASLLAVVVITEIISRKRVGFYTKQGFEPCFSYGLTGLSNLIIKGMKNENVLQFLYDKILQNRKSGFPGIAFNDPKTGSALILITDLNLIKEFSMKDNDVALRGSPTDMKLKMGFFMMNGENAMTQRVIFSEFFRIENLNKLIPSINRIIASRFEECRNKEGKVEITKSKEFIDSLMARIVNSLIFGEGQEAPRAKDGLSFSEELTDIMGTVFSKNIFYHPVNALSRDMASKYNLLPKARECEDRARAMDKLLEDYLKQRIENSEKYKESRKQFCLINMMINYNESAKADQKLSMNDMIGNCNVFLVAGFDTTGNSICSMLYNLAHKPEILGQVKESVAGLEKHGVSFEEIDASEILEKVVKESIRVNPPAGLSARRDLMVDFTLGKYKFLKGDILSMPLGPLLWDEDAFNSCRKFDISAINDKNKRQYNPFYMGKRNCVGQQLAQLEMKLVMIYVANRFKLQPLTDKCKYSISFAMQVTECDVKFLEL